MRLWSICSESLVSMDSIDSMNTIVSMDSMVTMNAMDTIVLLDSSLKVSSFKFECGENPAISELQRNLAKIRRLISYL